MLTRDTIRQVIQRAFDEDLPDITSEAIFSRGDRGSAVFISKSAGVLAGLDFAEETFAMLDLNAKVRRVMSDGERVNVGDVLAEVDASVIALLSGERTALNFMQRASGIATITREYVDAVNGTSAKIYDTRKTAPGLRVLDKYAVAAGGGQNHRFGLFDMYLVKNNHIDRAGSIAAAVQRIRGKGMPQKIMIEVRDMKELDEALETQPDFIMLDNMSFDDMRRAVKRTAGRVELEASGGITLDNVRAVAETGVNRISVGALTHSVRAMDISMRIRS